MSFSPYAYNTAPRFSPLGRYIDPLESVRPSEPNYIAHGVAPGRPTYSEDHRYPYDDRVSRLRAELAAAEEEERLVALYLRRREEEAAAAALQRRQQQEAGRDRERAIQALIREHEYHHAQEQHTMYNHAHGQGYGHGPGPRGHPHGHSHIRTQGLEQGMYHHPQSHGCSRSQVPQGRRSHTAPQASLEDALGPLLSLLGGVLATQETQAPTAHVRPQAAPSSNGQENEFASMLSSLFSNLQQDQPAASNQADFGSIINTLTQSLQKADPTSPTPAPAPAAPAKVPEPKQEVVDFGKILQQVLGGVEPPSEGPASSSSTQNPLSGLMNQFLGPEAANALSAAFSPEANSASPSSSAGPSSSGAPSAASAQQHPFGNILTQLLGGDCAKTSCAPHAAAGPSTSQTPSRTLSTAEREAQDIEAAIRLSLETDSAAAAKPEVVQTEALKGKAKEVIKAPSEATSQDIQDSLEAIETVAATFTALTSDFEFPITLDFRSTPTTSRSSSPDSTHTTDSTDTVLSKLSFTSNNRPVRDLDEALNNLIKRLDEVVSWENAEVRARRKAVLGLVADKLEEIERDIQSRWRTWSAKQRKTSTESSLTPAEVPAPAPAQEPEVAVEQASVEHPSLQEADQTKEKKDEHDSDWSDVDAPAQ